MPLSSAYRIRFHTPAKINTYLYIQRKREDGYHELLMDLIPVSFFDTIELGKTDSGTLTFESNLPGVETENNLVIKAVRLLENETGKRFSLDIKLEKAIPTGAGLGGGSGNAGGMLSVLNTVFELGFSQTALEQLALSLGADVPFFIDPKPSLAQGMGEKLTTLEPFDPLHIVLIYPGFPISTGTAYSHCHISARTQSIKAYTPDLFAEQHPTINDFWVTLNEEYPQLDHCREALKQNGAVFSGLSGSGSTIFGIFRNNTECNNAFQVLAVHPTWQVVACQTLSHYSYLTKMPGGFNEG